MLNVLHNINADIDNIVAAEFDQGIAEIEAFLAESALVTV